MDLFNLEKQIGFYAAYHHETVNKWIHIVCIPQLLWTGLVFLAFTGVLGSIAVFGVHVPITGALLGAALYGLFYVALEPVAGALYLPVLAVMVVAAHAMVQLENAFLITLIWHLAAWIAQFIGHGIFERRAPALLDSLLQALLLAPLFAWLEVLFLFGYRPTLQATLNRNAERDIAAFRNAKKSSSTKK